MCVFIYNKGAQYTHIYIYYVYKNFYFDAINHLTAIFLCIYLFYFNLLKLFILYFSKIEFKEELKFNVGDKKQCSYVYNIYLYL